MPDMMKTVRWQRSVLLLTHIVLVVVSIAALYLLREVFIPLALAIFFSFLLYPFFKFLQRRGVPRKLAVAIIRLHCETADAAAQPMPISIQFVTGQI